MTRPPNPADNDPHAIAHGYNLADLDKLARIAISRSRGTRSDYLDRYQAAWSAIAEHLCTHESPTPADLVHAGWCAVAANTARTARSHGYDPRVGRTDSFERYWTAAPGLSVEDRVVETVTLWQIMARLTDRQRQMINALAATGDYQLAAQAMGMHYAAFVVALNRARRVFLRWWFEGETPPKRIQRDRRRNRSRITTTQMDAIRGRYYQGATQAELAADYGLSRSSMGALLRGEVEPGGVSC
jgi:predicted DNA-binding protein (UPF0251 family)